MVLRGIEYLEQRRGRVALDPRRDLVSSSSRITGATDSPSEVFPVPGGPVSERIAPLPRRESHEDTPPLLAQLADREELGDAVLYLVEAGVVLRRRRAEVTGRSAGVSTRSSAGPLTAVIGCEPDVDVGE